ncbi:MAG: septal ring lytic transglycosylase RlpA family protein [Hyphomicrobium sp.]
MAGRRVSRAMPHVGLAVSLAALLAACSGTGGDTTPSRSRLNRPAFTEDEYGVSTSPRVSEARGTMPKGGGGFKLGSPYKVAGRWYVPREEPGYDRAGTGSWYGDDFHGRKTANGEIFDMHALTAAHPTLPLPSYAYVTNTENGRTILVRVNDRGPYVSDRIIDLSHASARALGYAGQGRARVRVRYGGRAPMNGDDRRERQYLADQTWSGGTGRSAVAALPPQPPRRAVRMAETGSNDDANDVSSGMGRGWSPSSYRAGLAGKPVPSGFAGAGIPRAAMPSPELPPRDERRYAATSGLGAPPPYDGQPPQGERLVWQASPPSRAPSTTGATQRSAPRAEAPPSSSLAYVQVGIYRELSRAERLRADLGHLGPVEVAAMDNGAGPLYRVRIGPMTTVEARATLAELPAKGVSGGSVVLE